MSSKVARTGNVMGDHVRIQGHGFMVLSYDHHLGKVWTIEGNFGNRAVLTSRQVQDHWSVGTLVESMLREERPSSPVEVAAAEESGRREGS